jgi:hypothetical protein
MRAIHVVLPALVGLILLVIAATSIGAAVDSYGESLLTAAQSGLAPASVGVALLLVSVAVSGRSRGGYVLGLGTAMLMILGGLAMIVVQIPYVADGGMGGAFGRGFIIAAGIWVAMWSAYLITLYRARPTFAQGWARRDRPLAAVFAALVVFPSVAYVALGAAGAEADAGVAAGRAEAERLVGQTSFGIRVVDLGVDPSATGGDPEPVEQMTIEVSVESHAAYSLASAPTLCLTDVATANDAAYKPDTYCWGGGGRAIRLDGRFADLTVPAERLTFRLDLTAAGSLCRFREGPWVAQLAVAPLIDEVTEPRAAIETFTKSATFDAGAPPPAGPTSGGGGCTGGSVSP